MQDLVVGRDTLVDGAGVPPGLAGVAFGCGFITDVGATRPLVRGVS
jgi:hypothetical protein